MPEMRWPEMAPFSHACKNPWRVKRNHRYLIVDWSVRSRGVFCDGSIEYCMRLELCIVFYVCVANVIPVIAAQFS